MTEVLKHLFFLALIAPLGVGYSIFMCRRRQRWEDEQERLNHETAVHTAALMGALHSQPRAPELIVPEIMIPKKGGL